MLFCKLKPSNLYRIIINQNRNHTFKLLPPRNDSFISLVILKTNNGNFTITPLPITCRSFAIISFNTFFMLNTSHFLIRTKIVVDAIMLASIIAVAQSVFFDDRELFSSVNAVILFINLLTWFFSARVFRLYADYKDAQFSYEWIAFLKTCILYSLLTTCILFLFFKNHPFNRRFLALHCSLVFVLIPLQKVIIRIIVKKLENSSTAIRNVLIVGARDTGVKFYEQYIKEPQHGYRLTGFVDDETNTSLNGFYLGKTSEIAKVITSHELDDIVITEPYSARNQLDQIISIGEKEGKRIRIIPDCFRVSSRLRFEQFGTFPVITLRDLPLDLIDNRVYKRVFDILFSSLLIVCLFSWLFPIIALLIKLSSKGPVFFKQERWGINNRSITCYKFRSMVADSKDVDANGKYLQAKKNDPRITKIGAFMRKTNLDELPQFFNVLLGSMSVVGPRPHPVPLNLISKKNVDNYMKRHWVKPGITGWAQIKGYRGETSDINLMRKRVEQDMWYIENWTLWLDLQIILQTFVNMVKGEKNAF